MTAEQLLIKIVAAIEKERLLRQKNEIVKYGNYGHMTERKAALEYNDARNATDKLVASIKNVGQKGMFN